MKTAYQKITDMIEVLEGAAIRCSTNFRAVWLRKIEQLKTEALYMTITEASKVAKE